MKFSYELSSTNSKTMISRQSVLARAMVSNQVAPQKLWDFLSKHLMERYLNTSLLVPAALVGFDI